MFKSYYGMSINPFDKQSLKESDSFLSHDHKEMIARLNYLKDIRGIGIFTAPPGMGKSYALRCFSKELNPNLHQMAYLCLSTISVSEFYKQVCYILGLDDNGGKIGMFKSIQDRIYHLYKEKMKPLILAIDEAQYLSSNIFKDLKMLMNYGYDSLNCFTLILIGESYLNNILEKPIHEALKQRITVHYNAGGLSDLEVPEYIFHKLLISGASKDILEQNALAAIHSFSQGNPRIIDNLMTDALSLGAQAERKSIDSEIILAAINNQALR